MADHPLRPAIHRSHGEPLPHHPANGTQAHPCAISRQVATPLTTYPCGSAASSGISSDFSKLSRSQGQVAYALLTRPPVYSHTEVRFPLDLHVLSTPPAFVLSQDQTLHCPVFFFSNHFTIACFPYLIGRLVHTSLFPTPLFKEQPRSYPQRVV